MMKFFSSITTIHLLLGCNVVVVSSSSSSSDFFHQIAKQTLARVKDSKTNINGNIDEKIVLNKSNNNRRMLIRESVRPPKLLPGDGIDKQEVEEEQQKAAAERVTQGGGGGGGNAASCDKAFFQCISTEECDECFFQMKTNGIDWTGVTADTECKIVLATVQKNGLCSTLGTIGTTLTPAQSIFCDTFHTCVYFDDEDDDQADGDSDDEEQMDCDALTECEWPGMHKSFLGDGICQDGFYNACYNSAVCGYDGGDCCEDTCETSQDSYADCGVDEYFCKDPNSTKCDPTLTLKCPPSSYKKTSDDDESKIPECTKDQSVYRLVMYDSFGDGWEKTTLKIYPTSGATTAQKQNPIFEGGLEKGSEGTAYLCLSLNPSCYDVDVGGGQWGREASWYIRGMSEGSPAIASGGGSMKCEFGVAGGDCENTCTGKSNRAPNDNDEDYKDFKSMAKCIDEKCMIQASRCREDAACMKCFQEDVPDYCFSIDTFLAVTDCSMCQCGDIDDSDFCDEKQAPGAIIPTPKNGGLPSEPKKCTPAETDAGTQAVLDFSRCMDFDRTAMFLYDFDENNFGQLDTFEACSHSFNDNKDHGGHTALGCMQVLVNAMSEEQSDDKPSKAIAQLAKLLYNDGQNFCDCAKKASNDCPLCPSFYNFKTLLYESLDACMALDEIDCDAWDEFQKPCKVQMMDKFKTVDFTKKEQCDYMTSGCGGSNPFPSFRRLDCEEELSTGSWDFYYQYSKNCLGTDSDDGGKGSDNKVTSAPVPVPAPTGPTTRPPTPYQPIKPSNIRPTGGKPYVPPEDSNTRPTYKSPDEKGSKSHWFRNILLIGMFGGIGYVVYKRQSDFSFVRYRQMNRFGFGGRNTFNMDDGDMYSGLAMESSTNFEPPSLPPTPMSMPSNGGYGA